MASEQLNTSRSADDDFEAIVDSLAGLMNVPAEQVQICRDYLLLVAHRNLGGQLQRKVGASDLVQETFLRAQRNIAQFRGRSLEELLSWLRQILLNHLIDERRKYRDTKKRRIYRERPLSQNIDSQWRSAELSSEEKSPPSIAIEHEEFAALSAAMDRLPQDYRQVIKLRTWERLSFSEVGSRMGKSTDAARKLWTRAIERLEREFD